MQVPSLSRVKKSYGKQAFASKLKETVEGSRFAIPEEKDTEEK